MRRRERKRASWRSARLSASCVDTAQLAGDDGRIPVRQPIDDGASPEGSDDVARILAVVAFNGVAQLISLAASNFTRAELEGLHDAMTEPLDNPEVRDDEVIACARDTLEKILSDALAEVGGHDCD